MELLAAGVDPGGSAIVILGGSRRKPMASGHHGPG